MSIDGEPDAIPTSPSVAPAPEPPAVVTPPAAPPAVAPPPVASLAPGAGGVARLRHLAVTRNPFPKGAWTVGVGIGISGIAAYGFLTIASRALGPERYSPLATLYTMVFLFAPGLFLPLEQEVGRALAARRARGIGGRPVVVRAGMAGVGLALLLVAGATAASGPLVSRLFDGQRSLLAGLALAFVAYSCFFLLRGTLAGTGRFRDYGMVVSAEGILRVVAAGVLWALGVRVAGWYGAVLGIASVGAATTVAVAASRREPLTRPGPHAPWTELSTALGYLLAGQVLAQGLVNVGPLAVKLLAPAGEGALAGKFLNGLVIARIPLFLFQAVQASLLPRLSSLAAAGHFADFRLEMRRLLVAIALIVAVGVVVTFAIGPAVVRGLFGGGFDLSHTDLALLALSSGTYMGALALAQGLIALTAYSRVAMGWVCGALGFTVALVVGRQAVLLRVEVALVIAGLVSLLVMQASLRRRLAWEERRYEGTP